MWTICSCRCSSTRPIVTDAQNCGNILAGVGPFADRARAVRGDRTTRRGSSIYMVNTGQIAVATVQTPGGKVDLRGRRARSTACPARRRRSRSLFRDTAGSTCGALLPTGNAVDEIEGVARCTLIDNGMPCVVVARRRMSARPAMRTATTLDAATETARPGSRRSGSRPGPMMNLGDVTEKSVPKMMLVAPPRDGGAVTVRSLHPAPGRMPRSACSARSAWRPRAWSRVRPPAEVASIPDGQRKTVVGGASHRRDELRSRTGRGRAGGDRCGIAAHRAQADGRKGLRVSTDEQGRIRSWAEHPSKPHLRAAALVRSMRIATSSARPPNSSFSPLCEIPAPGCRARYAVRPAPDHLGFARNVDRPGELPRHRQCSDARCHREIRRQGAGEWPLSIRQSALPSCS